MTPDLPDLGRSAECMHYISAFTRRSGGMTHWVILDDDNVPGELLTEDTTAENESKIADHFVQTESMQGFTGQMLVRALKIMNSPVS